MKTSIERYKVINNEAITITDGIYEGTVFQFGRVLLNPDEEKDILQISFEYNILENKGVDGNFKDYIGPILEELLYNGLINNSIVYCGGSD